MLVRTPVRPALTPFVEAVWCLEDGARTARAARERVLPTGGMHVGVRLAGPPFRFFEGGERVARVPGHAIVGGARVAPYVKDIGAHATSVGAQLRPGAAARLFGVPADELAGRHTPLEAVWVRTEEVRERLAEAVSPEDRLDVLEALLLARLRTARGVHPAIAHALDRFAIGARVGDVVSETGYSHRRFIDLFRRATGLPPKRYTRVLRFRRAVERLAADPGIPQTRLALETGYSDQAHFIREFRDHAGVTPGDYLALVPSRAGHLPEAPARG